MVKRLACIHGHFYQPPRENPWSGAVERQPSAGVDHDWNARVARECYVPNGNARVVDGAGRLIDVIDNYRFISFDFGPTLLAWYEKTYPEAYTALIAADKASVAQFGGHGNAIAQSFHHSILPLARERDRVTEIRWGMADFQARFGRKSEGLWLPECAVDDATLSAAAAEGVKFVILEPGQAGQIRPLSGGEWVTPSRSLRTGLPYLWKGSAGRSLALFFYDSPLSRAVAFEHAMNDSRAFAARFSEAAPPTAEASSALIATDGESYGHHAKFAEMGLAHMVRYALPERGLTMTNPGQILATVGPIGEVRLHPGATSWSCAHGVERWRSDCGCGSEGGRHQRWRGPLRAAVERLRDRLDDLFESKSRGLILDPWAARDAYITVILDRSDATVDRFLAEHAPSALDAEAKSRVLALLEIQRRSLMMFTSCGWFFDEISRLEPAQILLYAARAIELARGFGAELEADFVRDLAKAPSNESRYGDGAGVWNALVRPRALTRDHIAAHFAVSLLFEKKAGDSILGRQVTCDRFTRREEGGVVVAAGRARFLEPETREVWVRSFFSAVSPGQRVRAYACDADLPEGNFDLLVADAADGTTSCPLPPGRLFTLNDLIPDERERVLGLVLERRIRHWESGAAAHLDEILPLVEHFRGMGTSAPAGLAEEARLVLTHVLSMEAGRTAAGTPGAAAAFRAALERGRAADITPIKDLLEDPWRRAMERIAADAEADPTDAAMAAVVEAVEISRAADLTSWSAPVQTRFFLASREIAAKSPSARRAAKALEIAV